MLEIKFFLESYFSQTLVNIHRFHRIYRSYKFGRDYNYCTSSFIKTWTQVLLRSKSCSWHARDFRWWGSLTIVPVENNANVFRLSATLQKQFIIIISLLVNRMFTTIIDIYKLYCYTIGLFCTVLYVHYVCTSHILLRYIK